MEHAPHTVRASMPTGWKLGATLAVGEAEGWCRQGALEVAGQQALSAKAPWERPHAPGCSSGSPMPLSLSHAAFTLEVHPSPAEPDSCMLCPLSPEAGQSHVRPGRRADAELHI